jgi:tetratricopeptide (TPR) repeat protein
MRRASDRSFDCHRAQCTAPILDSTFSEPDLDDAIRLNPRIVRDYLNRSAAHGRKGDFDRALRDLEEALRLDAKNIPAVLSARGTLYSAMHDYPTRLYRASSGTPLLSRLRVSVSVLW